MNVRRMNGPALKTMRTSDQLEPCFHADKQQGFFWVMGSPGGPRQPPRLVVCCDDGPNALL